MNITRPILVGVAALLGLMWVGAQQITLSPITAPDTQKLNAIFVTDDIQSPRAGWDYDSDDANVVMVLQNEAFADAGADGTNGVYADYIWIRKGSLRDASIVSDDIIGGLSGGVSIAPGSLCPDGIAAIGGDGTLQCFGDGANLWQADSSRQSLYRDDQNYSLPNIYVGCQDASCATGMGDVTIGVKGTGVTKIDGADARLAFLGGSAIAITPTSASINTPVAGGARVIILGKDAADRLGIGTTDPQATLHVQGTTLVENGSWTVDNGSQSMVLDYGDTTRIQGQLSSTDDLTIAYDDSMIASGVLVTDRDAGTVAYAANPTDEVYAVVSMDNFGPGVVHFAVQMHNVTDPQSLRVSYTCMSDGTLCQETTWSGSGELFSVEFSVNSSVYTTHGVMMEIGHGSQTISQFFSYPVTVAQDLFLAGVSSQDCGTVAKCVVSKWTWTSMLNPVHVAMGFTPGASVTPDHMRSSVLGDVMIPGTLNSSQLRLSNLAPTNRTYKTLEEVNCKLLTVDSNGHFQLIDYMPERCAGSTPVSAASCGVADGAPLDYAPTGDSLCDAGTASSVSTTTDGWSWSCASGSDTVSCSAQEN